MPTSIRFSYLSSQATLLVTCYNPLWSPPFSTTAAQAFFASQNRCAFPVYCSFVFCKLPYAVSLFHSAPPFRAGQDALPYTCPANSRIFEKSFVHARRPFVTNALLTRARSPRQPSRTANPPYQMSLLIVEKRETKRKSACARQRDRDRARA